MAKKQIGKNGKRSKKGTIWQKANWQKWQKEQIGPVT